MTVGLVLVSHSAELARGLAELATQMAPDVRVEAAGGLVEDGNPQLGTDYDAACAAVERADGGDGVVLLYDIGSARMTAELVVESTEGTHHAFVVDAPFVEGTVAAAVAAQGGADMDGVSAAAASAAASQEAADVPEPPESPTSRASSESPGQRSMRTESGEPDELTELELRNEVGLHARPAALFARAVADLDATVEVRFGEQRADGASVLALMALGAAGGDRITVAASGRQAGEAMTRIRRLAERNFDE